ncbi:MAG: hypothetical protein RMK20_00545 [Verrucomicrobiales bacterium]|nr:hypothetical protein [Verrucomicrobiales bacterium]
MKKSSCLVVAAVFSLAVVISPISTLRAADSFWDIDGATPGAGGSAPAGTWDATTANWSADSTGSSPTAAWTPGDTAVFSAGTDASGTFTVTVSGTHLIQGVRVEEGAVTLSGGGLSINVTGGGTFDIASGLTTVISSVISGGVNNQNVTKIGGGQVNFTGANTYTGVTTVQNGTILLGNASALGTTAGNTVVVSGGAVLLNTPIMAEPIVLNGTGVGGAGALRSTGTRTWSGPITFGSDGVRISADTGTFTITGAMTDGGANYNVTFAGAANTRLNTGTFNIGTGIITKEGTGSIQTEAGITAGGMNLNDGNLIWRGIGGTFNTASSLITIGPNADSIGNVVFTGTTTSPNVGSSLVLNHPAIPVTVATASTLTFSGPVTGNGGLDVQATGSGKLLLNGIKTYLGQTKVTTGTLQLAAASGIPNSTNISVASAATFDVSLTTFILGSGQTLQGNGTVVGNVTADGTIAPGTSPGTLTLRNDLNLTSLAVLSFELAGNNTTVGGGVNDLLVVSGNLTLDGTLNVTELGAGSFLLANAGDKWRLINYGGTLADNGLALGSMPTLQPGLFFAIDTATAGQVNLMVVPEPSAALLGLLGGLTLLARSRRKR